jgi:ADP-heptose:LPS heptosyltransferase
VKILIIKLSALGDVIISTPLIRQIQQQHAGDEIYLLTTPPYASLFKDWPDLNIASFPRKGLTAFIQTVRWIRQQRFDVCYELQANDRTGLMLRFCRIPRVVSSRVRYPATHHPAQAYQREIHIFDRLNHVLEAGGLLPAPPQPWLPIDAAGQEKVSAWLSRHQLDRQPFVIMHAFASPRWKSKCWPHFGELAEMLETRGYRVVWVGAGTDAPGNEQLASRAGIDATNVFSIAELAELGRRSRFALTNDSGPMHVLSCSGIPVYSFFGPTKWTQSHALGQQSRVLNHPVPCSPCFLPNCPPDKQHACLAQLTADAVYQRLAGDGLIPSLTDG